MGVMGRRLVAPACLWHIIASATVASMRILSLVQAVIMAGCVEALVANSRPSAPAAMPALTTVHVHLPGADANQHLNVTIDLGSGPDWTIEGCVANVIGICKATSQVTLSPEQRIAYVRLWNDLVSMSPCKPGSPALSTRPFDISSSVGSWAGALPADAATISAPRPGPCEAPDRLAIWVAQRFGALP